MRKLTVTIKGLEQHIDGVVCGTSVDIKVYQGNTLLVSDTFTGKLSAPYSRNYDVVDAYMTMLTGDTVHCVCEAAHTQAADAQSLDKFKDAILDWASSLKSV